MFYRVYGVILNGPCEGHLRRFQNVSELRNHILVLILRSIELHLDFPEL